MVCEARWTPGLEWAPARLQLFVDDPATVAWGRRQQRRTTFGLLVLFWLVLGLPLSWTKGAVYAGTDVHLWIGVRFEVIGRGVARMTLPPAFVKEVLKLCKAFLAVKLLSFAQADSHGGKGRAGGGRTSAHPALCVHLVRRLGRVTGSGRSGGSGGAAGDGGL